MAIYYKFLFFLEKISPLNLYRKIRNIYNRARKGFAPNSFDIFEMDIAISEQIYQQLKEFKKENEITYPPCFNSFEEWQEILDEMIEGFDKMRRWGELRMEIFDKYLMEEGVLTEKQKQMWLKEQAEEYEDMMKKCKLFIEYLPSLWI